MIRRLAMLAAAAAVSAAAMSGCTLFFDHWRYERVTEGTLSSPPTSYKQTILAHFSQTLRDPDSAKYRNWSEPTPSTSITQTVKRAPTFINAEGVMLATVRPAWSVKVEVNSTNGYGGYTGYQLYDFLFDGEKLLYVLGPSN